MTIGRVVDNPVWLAPEVMMGKDYGPSADVYSLGIVLWEIVTGREPYAEFNFQLSSMLEDQILLGLRPTLPDSCPEFFAAVVRRCWHRVPSQRPSANEIMPMLDVLNIMFRL
jgi:serine/threonine protein kinase